MIWNGQRIGWRNRPRNNRKPLAEDSSGIFKPLSESRSNANGSMSLLGFSTVVVIGLAGYFSRGWVGLS